MLLLRSSIYIKPPTSWRRSYHHSAHFTHKRAHTCHRPDLHNCISGKMFIVFPHRIDLGRQNDTEGSIRIQRDVFSSHIVIAYVNGNVISLGKWMASTSMESAFSICSISLQSSSRSVDSMTSRVRQIQHISRDLNPSLFLPSVAISTLEKTIKQLYGETMWAFLPYPCYPS